MSRDILNWMVPSVLVLMGSATALAASPVASGLGPERGATPVWQAHRAFPAPAAPDSPYQQPLARPSTDSVFVAQAQSSIVTLPAPRVMDYWVSATRQPSGVIVFDGYAPDEKTRDALDARDAVDVNWLKLGSGAPAEYADGVDFGLRLLSRLSEGRFTLRGNVLTLSGVAADAKAYEELQKSIADGAPARLVVAMADIKAPAAAAYEFVASKSSDGNVVFSGALPGPTLERDLMAAAGADTVSTIAYASGEPTNFGQSAEQAVGMLSHLAEGEVAFRNGIWTISGAPASEEGKRAIETEFGVRGLAQASWQLALQPVESPVEAAQAPYAFAATRAEDGTITFTGNVPAAATQRFLATRGGSGAVDETTVAPDAPPEFARHLLEAMDLLTLIDTGTVSFDGQNWSASGQGGEAYSEAAVAEALGGNAADWSVSLAAPAVAPSPAQPPVSAPDDVVAEDPPAPPEAAPVDSDAGQEEASAPVSAAAKGAATPTPSVPEWPSPSDIASCQAELKALSDHNAILFQSGAAVITTNAQSALDAFAAVLQRCPDTDIYVEGHTDSDGDARANLALSVSRAEAVVNALAERGVASSRLYAVGYGESQPVADNTTAAGKAKNRRIVISVADPKGD